MMRGLTAIVAAMTILTLFAGQAYCMGSYCGPPACPPPSNYTTVMVPCVKTELVPQVVQSSACVPVTKVGYRNQKVLIKATPVSPCGPGSPCVKCFPQPFCKVVVQKVPYTYCESKTVPYYRVVYKRVCRKVVMPYTYKIDSVPLCR